MNAIWESITDALGGFFYSIFCVIFYVIDLLEKIFKAFAGTGPVSINGQDITAGNSGDVTDTGIVYYFLQSDLVRNMFLAILYLAIILLVVFTVMAVLRNMYQPQPKRWQEIIGNAIKGLGLFIFVPACSLLGVWLGNILLNAIDGATSGSSFQTTVSAKLFMSSAYNANKIRLDVQNGVFDGIDYQEYSLIATLAGEANLEIRAFPGGENSGEVDMDYEYYANLVDDCYMSGSIDLNNGWQVAQYYSTWNINYIILIAAGVFILYVLGSITFGMIKRLIMLVILFIVSPAVCAMYPIDEGNAYKSWAGEFKKNVLSAYGAVAGMNLFFAISPLFDMISLPGIGDFLQLVPLALMVAGLYVVKDIINLISGFAGGGNAYSDGAGLMSSVNSRRKQVTGVVNKGSKAIAGGFGKAISRADAAKAAGNSAVGAFFASAGSSLLKTTAGGLSALTGKATGIDVLGTIDSYKAGYKGSEDENEKLERYRRLRNVINTADKNEKYGRYRIEPDGQILERGGKVKDSAGNVVRDSQGDVMYDYKPVTKGITRATEADLFKAAREAGIEDPALKRFKSGYKSAEDFDADQTKIKEATKRKEAFDEAVQRQQAQVATVNSSAGTFAGVLGLTDDEVKKRVFEGRSFSADELSIDTLRANEANEVAAAAAEGRTYTRKTDADLNNIIGARQAVNDMISELAKRRSETQSAGTDLAESLRGFKGSDLKTNLSDENIDKLADRLKDVANDNTMSSKATADAMISAMNNINDGITKELRDTIVKESRSLIRELQRNTSETKPKDKK